MFYRIVNLIVLGIGIAVIATYGADELALLTGAGFFLVGLTGLIRG